MKFVLKSREEYNTILNDQQHEKLKIILFDAKWCQTGKRYQELHQAMNEQIFKRFQTDVFHVQVDCHEFTTEDSVDIGLSNLPCVQIIQNSNVVDCLPLESLEKIQDRLQALTRTLKSDSHLVQVDYHKLLKKIDQITQDEDDFIANCANTASIIYHELIEAKGRNATNWTGFYLARNIDGKEEKSGVRRRILTLGPFIGKPACKRIEFDKGVCGAAASTLRTQLVPNVHLFPGHIACDNASKSEIVVPVKNQYDQLVAVIDIDCPQLNGFSIHDQHGLERIAHLIGERCNWKNIAP